MSAFSEIGDFESIKTIKPSLSQSLNLFSESHFIDDGRLLGHPRFRVDVGVIL
jgi:hypothetical protein